MTAPEKTAVRREMGAALRDMSVQQVAEQSCTLCGNLNGLLEGETGEIAALAAFLAYFPGEVDLSSLIDRELMRRSIFLPISDASGGVGFAELFFGWRECLHKGRFGTWEPRVSSEHSVVQLPSQMVFLVPGLAFDRCGRRLGRGRGCYDNFFNSHKDMQMLKIGVCWSFQILEQVPSDAHDVSLDVICTEREYFYIKQERE